MPSLLGEILFHDGHFVAFGTGKEISVESWTEKWDECSIGILGIPQPHIASLTPNGTLIFLHLFDVIAGLTLPLTARFERQRIPLNDIIINNIISFGRSLNLSFQWFLDKGVFLVREPLSISRPELECIGASLWETSTLCQSLIVRPCEYYFN